MLFALKRKAGRNSPPFPRAFAPDHRTGAKTRRHRERGRVPPSGTSAQPHRRRSVRERRWRLPDLVDVHALVGGAGGGGLRQRGGVEDALGTSVHRRLQEKHSRVLNSRDRTTATAEFGTSHSGTPGVQWSRALCRGGGVRL